MKIALTGVASLVLVAIITFLSPRRPPEKPASAFTFPFGQTIDLQVGPKKMLELQRRRDAALAVGILLDDDSSWVKAKLIEGDQIWPVRMRLKGDWTDHLEGEKWSFRVELRDSAAWRRMTVFSLQSPERRGYLNEWLFHQVLAREGLLTPRYDYIQLRLNGRLLGPYAIEEHFSKELLESQRRREGPILKIDESGMWDARIASLRDSAFPYLAVPFLDAAPVRPFKRKHILKDSVLHAQFDDAQRVLAQLRAGVTPTAQPDSLAGIATEAPIHQLSQVYDLQLAARQYALTDLFAAYHSLIWHNRRFYFNPVTQRLEPVVFDGFSGPENDTYIPYPFWGYKLHDQSRDDAAYRDPTSVNVFQDQDFVRAYYQQLERYCAPAFLDSIFVELAPQIEARAHFLRQAYFGYRLDKQMLLQNAAKIRSALSDGLREDHFFLEADAGAHQLRIRNHNPLPVELWVESQFFGPQRQFLEANCGQAGQIEAHFDLEKGTPVYYCLPGSTLAHRLHWDK